MNLAVIIPAYNESESIGGVIDAVCAVVPAAKVIVISDGSADNTAAVASEHGATVLDLPCNLGVGGAVQSGLRHAREVMKADTVVRLDGDGQHPPAQIEKLLDTLRKTDADIVIGSRFIETRRHRTSSTVIRKFGNVILARFLSAICRCRITDPTSGYWGMQGPVIDYFSHDFPCEYPEPEAIALSRRQGYEIAECPISVRKRKFGKSSISSLDTVYFALRVGLAIVADRVRPIDRQFSKSALLSQKGGVK